MRLQRFLLTGCGAAVLALSAAVPTPAFAGATTKMTSPVIHEQFTPLACPRKPTTTVQIEGCAEHKVIAIDKTIDGLNAKIFKKLGSSGRGVFIVSNTDWITYRDAACVSESSIYSSGTLHPVAYANCLVAIDSSHVNELKKMLVAVSPGG